MIGIARARHSMGGANYHMQFSPEYKRRIFLDLVLMQACRTPFQVIAKELKVNIEALEFNPDHLHIFLNNCNIILQVRLQGETWSSIEAFPTQPPPLENTSMNQKDDIPTVKFYIDKQQGKHWMHQDADVSFHSIDGGKPNKTLMRKQGFGPRIKRKDLTLASSMYPIRTTAQRP